MFLLLEGNFTIRGFELLCQKDRQGILWPMWWYKLYTTWVLHQHFQLKVDQEIDLTTLGETLQKISCKRWAQVCNRESLVYEERYFRYLWDRQLNLSDWIFGDEIDESESLTQKVNVLLMLKSSTEAVSDLLLQEEFYRGQQIEQLQNRARIEDLNLI